MTDHELYQLIENNQRGYYRDFAKGVLFGISICLVFYVCIYALFAAF